MKTPQTFIQTQFSYWILILLPLMLLLPFVSEQDLPVALIFGLAGPSLLMALFYQMKVTVDDDALSIIFGVGLIRKKILLKDVKTCRPVKSTFWMGWGIRMIPKGWLYNSWGYDALELNFQNSTSVVWVGSPDVVALKQAVDARLGK